MSRLEHVAVEGFKGVERVEFDPGMVNVVTGRNNSGKTSLLEAIDVACDPTHVQQFGGTHTSLIRESWSSACVELTTADERRRLTLSVPDGPEAERVLWAEFEDRLSEVRDRTREQVGTEEATARSVTNTVVSEYAGRIDARRHVLLVSVGDETVPYVWYSDRLSDALMEAGLELHERLADDATAADERRPPVGNGPVFSAGLASRFRGDEPAPFVRVSVFDLSELDELAPDIEEEEHALRRDDLGDYLEERVVDELKSFDFDYLVFAENGDKRSVPFEFMGEGFRSLTRLLWELFAADLPDVVLLEEPETHMHPGYVKQLTRFLIELARDEGVQLFVTTHNHDFLNDFFDPALPDEEREFLETEFRLIQMQDGYAGVRSYDEAEHSLKELQSDLRGI